MIPFLFLVLPSLQYRVLMPTGSTPTPGNHGSHSCMHTCTWLRVHLHHLPSGHGKLQASDLCSCRLAAVRRAEKHQRRRGYKEPPHRGQGNDGIQRGKLGRRDVSCYFWKRTRKREIRQQLGSSAARCASMEKSCSTVSTKPGVPVPSLGPGPLVP